MRLFSFILLALLPLLVGRAALPYTVWSLRSPTPTAQDLNSVAFGNGTFVAVGASGAMIASTNGTHWRSLPTLTGRNLNKIIFAKGRFIACGDAGTSFGLMTV